MRIYETNEFKEEMSIFFLCDEIFTMLCSSYAIIFFAVKQKLKYVKKHMLLDRVESMSRIIIHAKKTEEVGKEKEVKAINLNFFAS